MVRKERKILVSWWLSLNVNSPALTLSKNSSVSFATIGKASAKNRLRSPKIRLALTKDRLKLPKRGGGSFHS